MSETILPEDKDEFEKLADKIDKAINQTPQTENPLKFIKFTDDERQTLSEAGIV